MNLRINSVIKINTIYANVISYLGISNIKANSKYEMY